MRFGIDGRCIQDHFPGIGRYAYALAAHVPDLAPDDEFVVYYQPTAENTRYDLSALTQHDNVRLKPVEAGPFSVRQQMMLPEKAKRDPLDLYHSPLYAMPYRMPCPTVVTIHDLIPRLYPESLPNPRLASVFTLLFRAALWRAAKVLVDAESTRSDLERTMGVPASRIRVVPLAAGSAFRPRAGAAIEQALVRFGLGKPYVLYVGINKPHKNLERLIRAWASLPRGLREKHDLVFGGREDPRYLDSRRVAEELGVEGEVRFLGAISDEDLPLLYSGALAFAFPLALLITPFNIFRAGARTWEKGEWAGGSDLGS